VLSTLAGTIDQRQSFLYAEMRRMAKVGSSGIFERMKRRVYASFIVLLSLVFTFGSDWPAVAQLSDLTKALREIDNKICRTFKATCKAKRSTHAKKSRGSVAAKSIPTKVSNVVKVQTPRAEPKITPPLPRQKPLVKPQAASLVTLPPFKPQKSAAISLPPAAVPSTKPPPDAPSSDEDKDCLQQLHAQGADFTVATGVVDAVATGVPDNGLCHVQNPIRLKYVKTQSNIIKLPEAPLLNCKYALQFSKWLSESAAPILAAQLNTALEIVSTGPGYECRGRNGDMFAKISEHGRGNAVDISTFSMHDGKVINVADAQNPSTSSYAILRALRSSACGYFTTVLGPGSNAAHASHFHFDLGLHGKSGTHHICE
jgi:hypothetical protein